MLELVIFDLDGLLVDSERAQLRAFNDVFRRYGAAMTAQQYQS